MEMKKKDDDDDCDPHRVTRTVDVPLVGRPKRQTMQQQAMMMTTAGIGKNSSKRREGLEGRRGQLSLMR
jgi:hypothetical protein